MVGPFPSLNHIVQICRAKLHAWFPGTCRAALIASITRDAPRYSDVLAQMRRDAAVSLALAAVVGGAALVATRAMAQELIK